ncbi:MAG: DUF2336 domain-containing protein [Bosea sp.]|uniref:hypothetical protein n=1 Tax=Bosea sp. (in: a-proteobacteria) TaxID=1871050 RepID=UPI002391765C|nr:DUF2336 domain-containing protein [Bosea sp. (in: a-proteobacteria)]MCP4733351.1 DUF2336 domain-containing protein [Bosea sp. (in: a-proteobacteria)]
MPSRIATDLAELARLASDGGLDLRQVALRVKTDLLLATPRPSPEDMEAFRAMAEALIPVVDDATATILARKLASWPHAPHDVLTALRARGGEVLAALIGNGMPLTAAEIEEIAADGGDEARTALAGRHDLTSSASITLAGCDSAEIDAALVANDAIMLPHAALDLLLPRAVGTPALGVSLLARADLPVSELTPLFLQASLEKRLAMIDAATAREALAPSPRPATLAGDRLSGLISTALSDRNGAFAALADAFGGDARFATAMANDSSRQLAALALIGCGASPEDATRFLIGLGDDAARSVERIFALVELMRALQPAVARRLAQQIGGIAPRSTRPGALQPTMDPSGTPARPGAERAPSRSIVQEVRRRLGGNAD